MSTFRDRVDAGAQLGRKVAAALTSNGVDNSGDALVLGLPRGGVVVAAEVARVVHAPLDVFVVRKIGAPHQPELALGAVADVDGRAETALNKDMIADLGIDDAYLQREIQAEHAEILRRLQMYRGSRPAPRIEDRDVIVVDDGIATGATVRAALQVLRRGRPRKLVLAVPVAPAEALEELRRDVDDVVCLSAPMFFTSVGRCYGQFEQTTDDEVVALLSESGARAHREESPRPH